MAQLTSAQRRTLCCGGSW